MMPRDRGLRTTSDHTPTEYDRLAEAIAEKDAELAALRAELAAMTAERDGESEKSKDLMDQLLYLTDYYDTNDYEAAEERVILMRRDNQRAAAARRVAEYCRGLRAELDGPELERAEIARRARGLILGAYIKRGDA